MARDSVVRDLLLLPDAGGPAPGAGRGRARVGGVRRRDPRAARDRGQRDRGQRDRGDPGRVDILRAQADARTADLIPVAVKELLGSGEASCGVPDGRTSSPFQGTLPTYGRLPPAFTYTPTSEAPM